MSSHNQDLREEVVVANDGLVNSDAGAGNIGQIIDQNMNKNIDEIINQNINQNIDQNIDQTIDLNQCTSCNEKSMFSRILANIFHPDQCGKMAFYSAAILIVYHLICNKLRK